MEHKIIGSIAMSILFIATVLGGLLIGRRLPFTLPTHKLIIMPLVLVPLWLILEVGQCYLDNFMTDGKTSVRGILTSDGPGLALFISVWIGAYIKQRSVLMAEGKAAPTLE